MECGLELSVLLSTTVCVIIVVEMLWNHEAQPSIFLLQYERQRMAVFILEDALCVWTNLGKHSLFVWLLVSSVKTGTRRIIRPDELSSVVRRSSRSNKYVILA